MRPIIAIAVSATLLLGGCSPTSPSDSTVPSSSTATREASGVGGAGVCIQNNSSLRMRIHWRGFPAPIDIARGASQCNTGQEDTEVPDVFGVLEYQPPSPTNHWSEEWTIIGQSEIEGPPKAGAWIREYSGRYVGACGRLWKRDLLTFDNGYIRGEIKLVDDTFELYKFTLNISDSTGNLVMPDVTECVTIWK